MDFGLKPMNIKEMVQTLSKAYVSLVQNHTPLRAFPSVMLWGPPGVGKSQGVRKIAEEIETKTGKKTVITDVRLLLFNPIDLRGIPTANQDKTLAVWLKPQIFQMDESADTVNILFLDEISAAPPSVQAAAYQITLDRMVGEHRLPENCIVIAAGNRVTARSVAYEMPRALANRLCHFEIKGEADAWHDWAICKGIHPYVVGYLEYNAVAMMQIDPSNVGLAFPTPRSWEMVSNILNHVSDQMESVFSMIVGCIGYSTAAYFKEWVELCRKLPSVENFFSDAKELSVKAPELLIALRAAIVDYVRRNPQKELLDRSLDIACNLPWSFRVRLLHDYDVIPDLRPLVRKNEVYRAALKEKIK